MLSKNNENYFFREMSLFIIIIMIFNQGAHISDEFFNETLYKNTLKYNVKNSPIKYTKN